MAWGRLGRGGLVWTGDFAGDCTPGSSSLGERLQHSGGDPSMLTVLMQQLAQTASDRSLGAVDETKNQVIEAITCGGDRAPAGNVC